MCDCIGLARTFDEGQSKSVRPSAHHPKCEDYNLIEYSKITLAGMGSIIVEKHEVNDFIEIEDENGEPKENFSVAPIFLTQDQFESLKDFDGF